jgi:drug/metabolite transporter (DMT)-like permease
MVGGERLSILGKFPDSHPDLIRGRLLVFLAAILWSLAGVFIKSLELHPLTIVFYRSLFASLFFLPCLAKSGWTMKFPLLVSVTSYTAAISSFVTANKLTSAANAIVLQYTAPIFVFLFVRWLFREPITRANRQSLLLGMIGVAIIFAASAGAPDARGIMIAFLSGFLFSVYMTNLRFLAGFDPGILTFVNNLVCWLALLPVSLSRLEITIWQLLALAVMGVVQLGAPYFFFSKGIEKIPLQEASVIVLIEPVLNPIWVALVVGEIPSAGTLIGGGVILLGLVLRYAWPGSNGSRSGKAPRGT